MFICKSLVQAIERIYMDTLRSFSNYINKLKKSSMTYQFNVLFDINVNKYCRTDTYFKPQWAFHSDT